MAYKKSNNGVYSQALKVESVSKPTDITNIIKRNKVEEQKEKLLKVFTLIGSSGLVLLFVSFIFL